MEMQVEHIEEIEITELPQPPVAEVKFEGSVELPAPVQAARIMKGLPPIVIRKRIDLQLAA